MGEAHAVAVIGAGALGRSIALAAALAGNRTILEDLFPGSLRKAEHEFRVSLDQARNAGRVSHTNARAALDRLEYAGSVEEAARQADLVIEAVPEDLESKSEIFILLDKVCRPATILVTSTSTISITRLASVTYRADRCVGIRFTYPLDEITQLQVIRGRETSDDTMIQVLSLASNMSREVVSVAEDLPPAVDIPA